MTLSKPSPASLAIGAVLGAAATAAATLPLPTTRPVPTDDALFMPKDTNILTSGEKRLYLEAVDYCEMRRADELLTGPSVDYATYEAARKSLGGY